MRAEIQAAGDAGPSSDNADVDLGAVTVPRLAEQRAADQQLLGLALQQADVAQHDRIAIKPLPGGREADTGNPETLANIGDQRLERIFVIETGLGVGRDIDQRRFDIMRLQMVGHGDGAGFGVNLHHRQAGVAAMCVGRGSKPKQQRNRGQQPHSSSFFFSSFFTGRVLMLSGDTSSSLSAMRLSPPAGSSRTFSTVGSMRRG